MDRRTHRMAYRSGYVALAGRPNVGKSTLLNRYLAQLVAAVSPKPQTTRRNQLGILTTHDAQVIFVDTPGLHLPRHRLGEAMNLAAQQAIDEADVVLALFDASESVTAEDRLVAQRLGTAPSHASRLAAINKIDSIAGAPRQRRSLALRALLPSWEFWEISATRGDNCDDLLARLIQGLPEGEPFFPEDQVTDARERDIAADLIRAAAMRHLLQEVPHSLAVRVDEYQERGDRGARISATIFVERESQKGIVIGRGGQMLKTIGSEARREIEAMSGRSCYLDLRVQVLPEWRSDPKALAEFGFHVPPENSRPARSS